MTCFALAIALLVSAFPVSAQEPGNGRYMVMTGSVTLENGQEKKVILKIDTLTGDTWEFVVWHVDLGKNSGSVEGWDWVSKDARATLQAVLKQNPNSDGSKAHQP